MGSSLHLEHFTEAGEFLRSCEPLLEDVALSRVMLGVGETARDQPDVYPQYHGWIVFDEDDPLAAASCTIPYNFILADARIDSALGPLAAAIATSGVGAPGVQGNLPTVGEFVEAWAAETGVESSMSMAQGLFSLTEVAALRLAPGAMRPAGAADRDLLIEWQIGFFEEADPDGPKPRAKYAQERVDQRLDPNRPQGSVVWVDKGEVVSMSAFTVPVATSIGVGSVYTPPQFRGRGYATALVASQSRMHLEDGFDQCLLNTDLANPTSNSIYQRIGYRQVGEARSYRFEGGSARANAPGDKA